MEVPQVAYACRFDQLGANTNRFVPFQYLVSRGWAVFAYNYRHEISLHVDYQQREYWLWPKVYGNAKWAGSHVIIDLSAQWGVADTEDAIAGLKYLADRVWK